MQGVRTLLPETQLLPLLHEQQLDLGYLRQLASHELLVCLKELDWLRNAVGPLERQARESATRVIQHGVLLW